MNEERYQKYQTCSYCHRRLNTNKYGMIRFQGGGDSGRETDDINTRYICVDCVIAAMDSSAVLKNRGK